MPSPNDCWGIEVGANAIKAIRLQRNGKEANLVDYEIIPYKKVLTTPDLDTDEAIRVALNEFKAKHDVGKATVVVSVPGHSAFARFAKLPPVEPKKVPDIVKFEAVQQIPFPIEQVEWDYQTFQDPDSPDVEVGIFAITRERAMNWLANFRAVGIPVHGVSLAPVASYNAMAHDMDLGPDSPGTIFMDIGTSATDLIIVEGSRLWLRTIPIGGHHFTEALVRSFKLNYSKAEKIKREAATSKYARQIFQAMRPVFVDLIGEVQKSLGFYQSTNRDAEITRLVGLGSTFRLPGLQKFLKQQLQLDVQRLQSFERIEAPGKDASQFNDNASSLAPAYGLAIQGIEIERVSCNLLPLALARRQIWQRKQPWMVAASLMFAASAGIAYSSNVVDRAAFEEQEPVRQDIQRVISQAESAQNEMQEIEGGPDPRLQIENIRSTLDYRQIWPQVLQDIEAAIQSGQPQEALYSGDAEAVMNIPREQRRLLEIDSITYEYQVGEDTIDLRTGESQSGRSSQYGGGYGSSPEMEAYMGGAEPGGGSSSRSSSSSSSSSSSGDEQPVFEITLTGTTPIGEAYKFLDETVVAWLQQNSERPNAPYRIRSVELEDVMPADAEVEDETRGRRLEPRSGRRASEQRGFPGGGGGYPTLEEGPGGGRGGSSLRPGGGSRPGGPGGYDELSPDGGGYGLRQRPGSSLRGGRSSRDRSRRNSSRDQQISDFQQFLPENPLEEEDQTGDWRFVIRWEIEILDPDEQREQNADDDDDSQNPQPVADAETRP